MLSFLSTFPMSTERQKNTLLLNNPAEKAMATHSSTLAWKIPWMGLRRVWQDWATSFSLFTFMHWRRKWQPTPVFLPGESQGRRSLVGCLLWGHTELDTTEAILQQQQQQQSWNFFCMISHWPLSPRFLEITNYTTFPGLQGQWSTVLLQEDQKSTEKFSKEANCKQFMHKVQMQSRPSWALYGPTLDSALWPCLIWGWVISLFLNYY